MITRRDALKSIAFIPMLSPDGTPFKAVPVGTRNFILFCDAQVVDVQSLAEKHVPNLPLDSVIAIVPLKLKHDQTIEDAIRLYEVT